MILVAFFYMEIFADELLEEAEESSQNENQTSMRLGDQRARQGRPSSAVADIVPTFSVEFRSPNKFTSERKLYQATVPEITSPGTKVKCDLKMGVYAPEERKVGFVIKGGNDNIAFTVSATRLKDFVFMDIKTRTLLNRESIGNYLLIIEAQDSETRATLDETRVNVSVTDRNDNPPLFSRLYQHVTIDEDIPMHTSVAKVSASDADIGPDGWLYYSFRSKTKSSFFAIDPHSGVVTVTRSLAGRKKRKQYELLVAVRDRSLSRSSTSAAKNHNLTITVRPVNRFSPEIKVISQMGKVTEGESGLRCGLVRVSDQDYGSYGEINKVRITAGNSDGNFRLKRSYEAEDEFFVEIVRPLDREKYPDGIKLVLTAFDNGNPPRNGTVTLYIVVEDTNDLAPNFTQNKYEAKISELAPLRSSVIRVLAFDEDVGKNGQVYYALAGPDSHSFLIDPYSGLITTAVNLDYESKSIYEFDVRALDAGIPMQMTSVKVSVEIVDANDHDPVFDQSSYSTEIFEDQNPGVKLITVTAVDQDAGNNGKIQFMITNTEYVPFSIDAETGDITALTSLDRDMGLPEHITLKVRALDFGTPFRRETETYVHIRIKAWNDNFPVFEYFSCDLTVAQNAPIGTVLITLSAIDTDIDSQDTLEYSIEPSGNLGQTFSIDLNSGELRVSKSLREAQVSSFKLYATVSDTALTSKSPVQLKINIVSSASAVGFTNYVKAKCRYFPDYAKAKEQVKKQGDMQPFFSSNEKAPAKAENMFYPEFQSPKSEISVSEDVAVDTTVTIFTTTDKDQGFDGMILFSIVSGNTGSSFDIDMHTGVLYVALPLDREKVPQYTLNISASDCGLSRKATFTVMHINVLDVNDNSPVFEKERYEIDLLENITRGQTVLILEATDSDEGSNGLVSYTVLNDFGGKFRIDSRTGRLSVASFLDYEEHERYDIEVQAFDNARVSQKMTPVIVTVKVIDINDNAPTIIPRSFNVSIPEDLPDESVVATVTAEDPDTGLEGELQFSFVDSVKKFKIDPSSGVIRLRRQVDYEWQKVYNLTVKVSDKGNQSLSSYGSVIVNILDVNENNFAPVFKGGPVLLASVLENQPSATSVLKLRASDLDSWFIGYAVIDGTGMDKFKIDAETSILRTTKVLYRKDADHYWLNIQAKDGEINPLYTNIPMLITVSPTIDDPPYFNPPLYYPTVQENAPSGKSVVRVEAHDPGTDGSNLEFSIVSGNENGKFTIDRKTGLITTTKSLDREEKDRYELTVRVSNGKTSPQFASVTFTVTVTDDNDNDPYFLESTYYVIVKEREASSSPTEFLRVTALDKDIGSNSELCYGILLSERDAGKLTIDQKTGIISSKETWQEGTYMHFKVNATDGGTPPRSVSVSVGFEVEIKNEPSPNAPIFQEKIYKHSIAEDADVGQLVGEISADDLDFDYLSYSIIAGNIGNKFKIDRERGEVTLNGKLDREETSSYSLVVAASDDHNVGKTNLVIDVLDRNDNAPQPAMTEYQVQIKEDAASGTTLTKVEAKDPDEGASGTVRYTLVRSVIPKSLSLFKIDSLTGEMKTIKSLDYEDMKEHTIIIKASDKGSPKRETLFSVVISVVDVNDHKPVFLRSKFEAEVQVDTMPGASVLRVFARDEDDGTNAMLKFSIKAGNANSEFFIDQNSGILQVATKLSHSVNMYKLQVQVSDCGTPAKTADAEVVIFVRGIKKPTVFERSLYQASIKENLRPGYPIINVVFNGSLVSYELKAQESACWRDFQVNRRSGLISNKKPFDAEELSECKLLIGARGSDGEEQTQVIVKIADENDNAPLFSQGFYTGHVTEGSPKNSPVRGRDGKPLVIHATDADVSSSDLLYEVIGSSAFLIDPHSGALKTKEWLDFESVSSHKFKVKVSDGGDPNLASFTDVEVLIRDVNDLPPKFISSTFSAVLYLPTSSGTEILEVSATDGDSLLLTNLSYSISTRSHVELFDISSSSGVITVKNASLLQETMYQVKIRVSDGNFTDKAMAEINCKALPISDLKFSRVMYNASVMEGISTANEIAEVRVVGYSVGEIISYSIVTPSEFFGISESTGVVSTLSGKEFDREAVDRYDIVVQARDYREPWPRVAQSVVSVAVGDMNDNEPMFTDESYFFVVQKSVDLGVPVGRVLAVDKDAGTNGEVRYLLVGGDEGRFRVEHRTGIVKVRSLLDGVEVPKVFSLQIEAHDLGPVRRTSQTIVKVKVVDKETPIFDQLAYSEVVKENVKIGHRICSVQARSPGGADIVYGIMQGNPRNEFSVDFKTGLLSVEASLDYETQTSYQLTVRATDTKTSSFGEVHVDVTVVDVNDISPVFNQSLYLAKVSEAVTVGTSVISVDAFDRDSGINKALTYRLESLTASSNNKSKVSEYFSITKDGGEISVAKELDYEKHIVHELKVVVTDGGTPSLTGEARVRIVVEDANDNPPTFEQDSYASSISGDAGPGVFVTRVIAVDPDESDARKLRYSISSGQGKEFFHLDPESGVLTISRRVGLERGKVYDVGVEVTDGKSTAETSVRVIIGNTNDHSPLFDQEVYSINFHENYPEGTFVTMVTATDEDSGSFARLWYSIKDLAAAEKFTIDAETGMIYSRLAFDRENSSHAFTSVPIQATDGGGRFGFCTVEVRILDENDNQPKFELPQYEVTIQRSKPVGTPILVTSASDADTGSNSALTYVILGHQTPPVFKIETHTGSISIAQEPEEKTYKFYVLVKDGGNPQLRNMIPVSVNVLSKSARILQFDKPEYRVSVPENFKVGTVVTTLHPTFPGSGRPSLGFKIIPGNSPSSLGSKFSIDSRGQLKLSDPLDYETLNRYVLVIEAKAEVISQVARTVVVIIVTDINDNKPHFVSNPYRVSVPENTKVGSKVLRVFAEDLDSDSNGDVVYNFTTIGKHASRFFSINQHSGWIRTALPLDREISDTIVLDVRATDRGKDTQLSGYTSVRVTILDVNDSPPKFSRDLFEMFVREDALIGQEVGTLEATDRDSKSDIFFFILSGDPQGKFGIEQKTGKIFVHTSLDREMVSSYKLNVSASDGLYTSYTSVNITVLDANDNSPVCAQSISIVPVSEGVRPGTEIVVVEATDDDADDNGRLKYSIFGQGIGVFTVENRTGRLLTVTSLDREKQDMYNFMVSAEDRGGRSCFTNVTILLDDVNDNAPVFTQAQYSKSVYEDARINQVLLQVKADDADIGRNRKISYSLVNTAGDTFSINSETGIITLKKGLNREQTAEYTLKVRAQDRGIPAKSGDCTVVIQVLNINDVPPEFPESRHEANVSEDARRDTLITTIRAISREATQEELTYAILAGPDSDLFAIDKTTGDITLQGDLDFETAKRYSLMIQVRDAGPPVLSATASLSIVVTDANDNAPKFGQSDYRARVDENSALDTFLVQVFATDLDHGSNRDIRYKIVKGNEAGRFKIGEMTGIISVAAPIDHEVESRYSLTVQARDEGHPPLSSEAQVNVLINDINDNPPEFSHTNFTVSIRESAPVGTEVIFLRPHDRDGPGNGAPFTFMRLDGDGSKFKLQRNGRITKAGPLSHQDGEHNFKVRVFDNGDPRQFIDKTVRIKVVESVTHPPHVQPLNVYLKLYGSQFNGGVIGSVQGSDRDRDPLTYSIVDADVASPFTITTSGEIRATSNVFSKIYNLNVSVTDGKYFSYAPVEIDVSDITDDILKYSLTLRLSDLGPGAFVERNLVKCREYLGALLSVPPQQVQIWSLQSVGSSLDVVFAVMKSRSRGFFESYHIANKLNSSRGNFQRQVGVTVSYIRVSQCRLMQCPENYSCQTVFKPQNKQIRIMSERTTYISYEHSRSHACVCDKGCVDVGGQCASNPCPIGYQCSKSPNGYQCTCVDSSKCDLAKAGCKDTTCKYGDNAMTFTGESYIKYRLKGSFDEPSRSISLALRTTEPRGTLVFAAGQYDYSILEIVEGHLQLRFDFGSGAGVVNLDWANVDDGKWHHVEVTRQGNHATLILDHGVHRAWNKSPGKMRILNLDDNAIYFGAKVLGSKTRRDMSGRGQRVENGFKGCLQNLNMNGEDLPMDGSDSYVTAQPNKALFGCKLSGACRVNTCPRASRCVETLTSHFCDCLPHHSGPDCRPFEGCEANPCLNYGTCFDDPIYVYRCECPEGYTGTQCEIFIGKCASAPCQNGGTCFPGRKNGFNCTCPEGVKGQTCEQDSRPCASNPCSFNAQCTNIGSDFTCRCPEGLSGKTCDEGYNCKQNPCHNGGTCEEKNDGKTACSCLETYTGLDCSLDVDECPRTPCKNGGLCENTFGGFICNCSATAYGGRFCEQVLANVDAREGFLLGHSEIIGIAVVLAVLLLVVILVVFILRWRAKRRRELRAQAEAAKTSSVLKVSPPVVGSEVTSPEPPTPPPREVHRYNVDALGMPPGYDAEDSWRRRERARKDFGTMKTLTSISDNLPNYHWDYTDIPDDLVPRTPLSKEDGGSYEDSPKDASVVPEVPQRPSSFRSSQGSLDAPEVPKRPRNYKVSESEDGYGDPVPNIPKKPLQYLNPKGKSASRYSMDSRYSEFSDATDLDPDIFKGRFPRPPKEPYPESLDQHPVGSYAPTLTARGSELGSITDGMNSEDDLEQVYLGNRMEACDDSPENSYLHSENCSEDEDDEVVRKYAYSAAPDPEFHKALQREISQMMNELEELKLESEL